MSAFVPGPAAVLVIDVQESLFRASPRPWDADHVIQRTNRVTSRARKAGAIVIFVQHDGQAKENLSPLTPGWCLHADVERLPGDLVIRKTTCDAFFETSLEAELSARRVRNLVLTGYATEFCVDATLRAACSRGLRVIVISDAHTTHDNPIITGRQVIEHHNWAWANCIARPGVAVVAVNDLLLPGGPAA